MVERRRYRPLLPKLPPGRPSEYVKARHLEDLAFFCARIIKSGEQLDDPDHNDHHKRYVQEYIERFGVRKCEANALVVEPEIGRQLCRDAILEHIPEDAIERYERRLARERLRLQRALRERVS